MLRLNLLIALHSRCIGRCRLTRMVLLIGVRIWRNMLLTLLGWCSAWERRRNILLIIFFALSVLLLSSPEVLVPMLNCGRLLFCLRRLFVRRFGMPWLECVLLRRALSTRVRKRLARDLLRRITLRIFWRWLLRDGTWIRCGSKRWRLCMWRSGACRTLLLIVIRLPFVSLVLCWDVALRPRWLLM